MRRPLLSKSIVELEKLFATASAAKDVDTIRLIDEELTHRKTPRSGVLKAKVDRCLARVSQAGPKPPSGKQDPPEHKDVRDKLVRSPPAPSPPADRSLPLSQAPRHDESCFSSDQQSEQPLPPPIPPKRESPRRSPNSKRPTKSRSPHQPISDGEASRLIAAWTAIEVLSPSLVFRRPSDLADGEARRVADLHGDRQLPWERGEKSIPSYQLFYQVVVGAIRMDEATGRLLEIFKDTDIERLPPAGFAPIAVLTLDRYGNPAGESPIALSSFAWGLPLALAGQLSALGEWTSAERKVLDALGAGPLRADNETGKPPRVDHSIIDQLFRQLLDLLKLPQDLVDHPKYAIRVYHWWKAEEPPDPPPMGSFFLGDLARIREAIAQKSVRQSLSRYLGMGSPSAYLDLLSDDSLLAGAVSPALIPPARWPSENALVTLQQSAVNLAAQGSSAMSLLPVNGPPGTGKTTLLRDLVASVVLERARRLVEFEDPASAFTHTSRVRRGGSFSHLYRIDDRLKGYEIVVASSNNKAVENVSKELPLQTAVSPKMTMRYFATIADNLYQGKDGSDASPLQRDLFTKLPEVPAAWGLISATLGNARNRHAFTQAAWRDDDFGLRTYLLEASGTPQLIEVKDPKTGRIVERRKPRVILQERPPSTEEAAKKQWRKVRSQFRAALNAVLKRLETMERARQALDKQSGADVVASARRSLQTASESFERHRATVQATEPEVKRVAIEAAAAERELEVHKRRKPNFLSRFVSSAEATRWSRDLSSLEASHVSAAKRWKEAETLLLTLRQRMIELEAIRNRAEIALSKTMECYGDGDSHIAAAVELCGDHFADAAFFERHRDDVHRDTPWLDNQTNALRADLFVLAMQVHRAFIDAAAKPIRNNLDVLFRTFFGRSAWSDAVRPLLPDLWATFHCVVPVTSTTLASVERMFGALSAESIGRVLMDEAGQACPQHAAGLVMRAKRVAVVGDPLQLEPVTSLPSELADTIASEFKIDSHRFMAPNASVQSLADASSEYGTTIGAQAVWVGIPLIVHRRCADPMFSLANKVAYDGLMVNGRGLHSSKIRSVLGDSHWIDVQPIRCDDKWSEAEWEVLKLMLERLGRANVEPDFYVISPFRIVAQRLRDRIAALPTMKQWIPPINRWVLERIGTVHTAQGREADTVFIVLGAAEPARKGAREWAGAKPNLLNVAVTRAKENIYVIGNRYVWASAGSFSELELRLPGGVGHSADAS